MAYAAVRVEPPKDQSLLGVRILGRGSRKECRQAILDLFDEDFLENPGDAFVADTGLTILIRMDGVTWGVVEEGA